MKRRLEADMVRDTELPEVNVFDLERVLLSRTLCADVDHCIENEIREARVKNIVSIQRKCQS
jgi:hypothetical protein